MADALLLGLVCGFGVYLLETFAAVAVVCLLFLLLRGGLSGSWRSIPVWGFGAALGAAPLLLYGRGMQSLQPLPLVQGIEHAPLTLWRTLTDYLPRAMGYDNLEGFPALRWAPNGIEYALLLTTVAALIVWKGRSALRAARGLGSSPAASLAEAVLLAYVAVYLVLYSMHPLAGQDARHLLFMEPSLSILSGLGLAEAWARRRSLPALVAWGGALLLTVAFADRVWQGARLFQDDGVYGPLGRSDPRAADATLALLKAHGVDRVVSEDWDLSWRIVFKSDERITARHSLASVRRALSEDDAHPFAVILNPGGRRERRVSRVTSEGEGVERFAVAEKAVYVVHNAPPAAVVTADVGAIVPDTYMAFGDSLTNGDGSSDEGGYRTRLESKLQSRFGHAVVLNEGESGSGSVAGAQRIAGALAQRRPAFTLILYGTNDWSDEQGWDRTMTLRSLRRMLRAAVAAHSRPLLATLPPTNVGQDPQASVARNRWVRRTDAAIRALAADERVALVDLYPAFERAGHPEKLFSDGLHPNDAGYEVVAEAFFEAIVASQGTTPSRAARP
jgi:lysophospholipase L1-like esterase